MHHVEAMGKSENQPAVMSFEDHEGHPIGEVEGDYPFYEKDDTGSVETTGVYSHASSINENDDNYVSSHH